MTEETQLELFSSPEPVMEQPSALDRLCALVDGLRDFEMPIKEALQFSDGGLTYDDVVNGIVQGRLGWWPLANSFMVTQVYNTPQKKFFNIYLAGGDLVELLTFEKSLVSVAKAAGCNTMIMGGRRGWERVLPQNGYSRASVVMHKEL